MGRGLKVVTAGSGFLFVRPIFVDCRPVIHETFALSDQIGQRTRLESGRETADVVVTG
jgi:hypothetical protein